MRFQVLLFSSIVAISAHICAGYLLSSFSSSSSSSSFVKNEFFSQSSLHKYGTSSRLYAKAEGRKRRKAKSGPVTEREEEGNSLG